MKTSRVLARASVWAMVAFNVGCLSSGGNAQDDDSADDDSADDARDDEDAGADDDSADDARDDEDEDAGADGDSADDDSANDDSANDDSADDDSADDDSADDDSAHDDSADDDSADDDSADDDSADDDSADDDSPTEGDAGGQPQDDPASDDTADDTASDDSADDAADDDDDDTSDGEGPELPDEPIDAPGEPSVPGSVPLELVGVWQQTRSSSGDYENSFGETFSLTSGFSVQLKIGADGSYYLAHYASGVSATCDFVTQFDQSVGTAVFEGDTLTLYPQVRRLDVQNCSDSGTFEIEPEPMVLSIALSESRQVYGNMRMYYLELEGLAHPMSLSSLFVEPTYEPIQPTQPAEFVLGEDPPYADLQGFWLASPGTDPNFFDPGTGEFYWPELNGADHHWFRFAGEEYETAVALQNVNTEGVCKTDLIYYERGKALLAILEDVGGQGIHFYGDVRLEATLAQLIVNIRECDETDQVLRYDLSPLSSYYHWIYYTPDSPPERIEFACDYPTSEWQGLLCDRFMGFTRAE